MRPRLPGRLRHLDARTPLVLHLKAASTGTRARLLVGIQVREASGDGAGGPARDVVDGSAWRREGIGVGTGTDRVDRLALTSWSAAPLLSLFAAVAWVAVIVVGYDQGAMPGTMGLSVVAFLGVWTLMMAAMMLPGAVPFASFYTRTFTEHRHRRVLTFASGYLLVWASIGLPAFGLAWIADQLVIDHQTAATAVAVLVFLACGIYQLTTLKDRCLALCRSPLGFTLRYASYRGPGRDLRAGALHGGYCASCCWALMCVLVAFGLMNLIAMATVAAVVFIEKTWRHGVGFARAAGVASIVLAVLVVVHPAIASGLYSSNSMMTNGAT